MIKDSCPQHTCSPGLLKVLTILLSTCHLSIILCCTMACFHMISISLIFDEDYRCAYYFLCRLPLCVLLVCSMTHYDITMGSDIAREANCNITMGNDVARNIHYNITMSNGIAMCTSQCIMPNWDIAVSLVNSLKFYTSIIKININKSMA